MRTFGDKRKNNAPNAFIGREELLALFRQNLTIGSDNEAFINIFNVFGQGGVGKSTLLKRYIAIAKEKAVVTTYIDQENKRLQTIPEFMAKVAKDFGEQGAKFTVFQERYKTYLKESEKLEKEEGYPSWAKSVGSTLAKMGMNANKTVEGGMITEQIEETVVKQSGEWLEFLRKKLGNKDAIQLMTEPLEVLTPLWLQGLNEFAEEKNFALFIDTYGAALPILDLWLRKVLNQDYGELTYKILLVISGRNRLAANDWSKFTEYVQFIPLQVYTHAEAEVYLKSRGITQPETIATIITLSSRLPVLIAILADEAPVSNLDISDPSDTAVKRFLKWIKDPIKTDLALKASLPRYLNKNVLVLLLPSKHVTQADALFSWLKDRPFVQNKGLQWTYHPIVRDLMLRYQRQLSEEDWGGTHQNLANFYQTRVDNMAIKDKLDQFKNELCHQYLLEYCFHQLCAGYQKNIPFAIQGFATIFLKIGIDKALPWVKTIQAVENIIFEQEWGNILEKGLAQLRVDGEKGNAVIDLCAKITGKIDLINQEDTSIFFKIYGNALLDKGKLDLAIEKYREAIRLNPKYASVYSNLGLAFSEQGRLDLAIEQYEKAIKLNPKDPTAYSNLGLAFSDQGRLDLAIEQYEEAIKLNPKDAITYSNLGIALSNLGKLDLAVEKYEQAIRLKPMYVAAYYNLGITLSNQGKYDLAIEKYEEAIRLNPKDVTAYSNLGNALSNQGKYDLAIEQYEKAIRLNPDYASVYSKLGNALSNQGKYDLAIEQYEQSIRLNPEDAIAYNNLGIVLSNLGKLDLAIEKYEQAIRLNPKDATAYSNLGIALSNLGKLDLAIEKYEQAIRLNPKDATAYSYLGNVLSDQGKFNLAIEQYKKAISLNPKDAVMYSNLGLAFANQGKFNLAIEQYKKAISLNPNYARPYYSLGNVLADQGKLDLAIQKYEQAITLNPKYARVHQNKRIIYNELIARENKKNNDTINSKITAAKRENLKKLNLSNLTLSTIPEEIFELGWLEELILDNNNIVEVDSRILMLKSLKKISLENNPIKKPPLEIIRQGYDSIEKYYDEMEIQGSELLYEAKLIIVGEGGVGKTTLARKLINENSFMPKEEETTRGIDIQQLIFKLNDKSPFTINIWDFGGQEIYHATHQFFLTKRSLYILVDDTRKDGKSINDLSFRYWLQTVELFGGNSPLLIVQNEKGDRSKDIDLTSMKARFPFLQEKYTTNLLTNRGLLSLTKDIKHYIQKLPHIGQILPKKWILIRHFIKELSFKKPYISLNEYLEICRQYDISEKPKALHLSQYLHDLGVFLHFQDDPLLEKILILQKDWATRAMYMVLDNEKVKQKKGFFDLKDVLNIWSYLEYQDRHIELLALMLKFELCYQIDNDRKYLIPQLLPASQPTNLDWDYADNIQLRYRYEFMPKGIISRFIVRSHNYIKNIELTWKNGSVLKRDETYALINELYAKNEININVRGRYQRDFMTILSEEIDRINDSFERIKVKKLIPCNCSVCQELDEPHFYDYEMIFLRIGYGKKIIECNNKPFYEVSLLGLVDSFKFSKNNSELLDSIFNEIGLSEKKNENEK